jgi:hypothetical protein
VPRYPIPGKAMRVSSLPAACYALWVSGASFVVELSALCAGPVKAWFEGCHFPPGRLVGSQGDCVAWCERRSTDIVVALLGDVSIRSDWVVDQVACSVG